MTLPTPADRARSDQAMGAIADLLATFFNELTERNFSRPEALDLVRDYFRYLLNPPAAPAQQPDSGE